MTRRRKVRMQAAALSVAGALAASCGSGSTTEGNLLEEVRDSGTPRVSNTQANPPYSFVDDSGDSGDLVGFDVDVAEEIATRMGIDDVEFVVGTFETFIPGLQSDKWDAVVSGLSITEERQQQIEFSCPYQVNDVAIFVAPGTEGIEEEEDLSGRPAGHVHHTANINDYEQADVPALIRGIYRYHTQNLGWSDLAYNFVVDQFGQIWQGRAGGAARAARGAHTLEFNGASCGVAVIGNYDLVAPSSAAVRAIVELAAWKLDLYGLDPSGSAEVVSEGSDKFRTNEHVTLPVIDGHRDTKRHRVSG